MIALVDDIIELLPLENGWEHGAYGEGGAHEKDRRNVNYMDLVWIVQLLPEQKRPLLSIIMCNLFPKNMDV